MRLCYLDESGVPELTGGTTHFVFVGVSIQAEHWKAHDTEIARLKQRFGLKDSEIHTGWMARNYTDQAKVANFENLDEGQRRQHVLAVRAADAARVAGDKKRSSNLRKYHSKTAPYIHLTHAERVEMLRQVADGVAGWDDCRIFAECTNKTSFGGLAPVVPPFEEAFTQVVSRLHKLLEAEDSFGLLIQDRNETVARRLVALMSSFHQRGTRWIQQGIPKLVETPLFVDSHLTSIVQVADLCAYAIRRFCENGERDLFDRIYPRFQTNGRRLVGVRHYVGANRRCLCTICKNH